MTTFLLLLCPTQTSVELTTQYIAQTQPCNLHQSSCISLPNSEIVDWTNMPSLCVCMIVHACGGQKSTLRCCSLVAICLFLYFFITFICMMCVRYDAHQGCLVWGWVYSLLHCGIPSNWTQVARSTCLCAGIKDIYLPLSAQLLPSLRQVSHTLCILWGGNSYCLSSTGITSACLHFHPEK